MKILFICTHNRCRSILAEAICQDIGQGILMAASAGSEPSGTVHPLSLQYLKNRAITTQGLCSESWHAYEAWQPDVVITVCDSAAAESCPLWMGDALKVHWGLADPSRLQGSDDEIAQAFNNTIDCLSARIQYLVDNNIHQQTPQQWPNIFKQAATF